MVPKVTMLGLVQKVMELVETESEVIAMVAHMVNTGVVQLGGNFRGSFIVLDGDLAATA